MPKELTITTLPEGARLGGSGPCALNERHEPHLEFCVTDIHGVDIYTQCHGQFSDCGNCDDRKCMDCVLRYVHDYCADSCPMCC